MSKKGIQAIMKSSDSYKPTITLDVKQIPELKNWKITKKYSFTVEAELVSLSDDDYDERLTGRFKVLKVDCEN